MTPPSRSRAPVPSRPGHPRGIAWPGAARGVMMVLSMSVRFAFAFVALAACSPGTDPQPDTVDAAGAWVEPQGVLTLTQTLYTASDQCPALAPRGSLEITVADDGTVTVAEPVVLVEASTYAAWEHAAVFATATDDWDGVAVTVEYELSITAWHEVDGYGGVSLPGCDAEVRVVGTRAP